VTGLVVTGLVGHNDGSYFTSSWVRKLSLLEPGGRRLIVASLEGKWCSY